MNEQDSTTPQYDPQAYTVILDGVTKQPTIQSAWQLTAKDDAYYTKIREVRDLTEQIDAGWSVVMEHLSELDESFIAELGAALGKSATGTVVVTVSVGSCGYESTEFLLEDIPLNTDLDELADKIKRNTTVSTSQVEVSITGYLVSGGEFVDERHDVDYDISLDDTVEVEVSCEWR